ncbi:MAG: TatD family hydrolase [Rhodospirillales bacterium]|nr:TatD family hydrolase [Rhodospirillales bacterium]
MLVDSHCHLDFPDFAQELDEVVARARRAGVRRMVTICTRVSQFDKVLAVAERFDDVVCTVGVHPHEAAVEADADTRTLVDLAKHPKVVGIGECGLDYFYEHSPRDRQQASFRSHIAAARESGLPLIVHTRDADEDMAQILTEEMLAGAFTGVLHCFSSSRALADTAIGLGFYISLSGIVTFKKAEELRETARAMPADRLLVETDAPYLAPMPMRGKRNEPAYVTHTAQKVADIRGVDAASFVAQTGENFFRLFPRVSRPAP